MSSPRHAVASAQTALEQRTQAKALMKEARHSEMPVPYYAQNIVTMISKTSELAGLTATASLAANEMSPPAAKALAKATAHLASATKSLSEALALAVSPGSC